MIGYPAIERLRKADMLDQMQHEHDALIASFASMTEDEMQRPGVTDIWSVKDLLAHLTGWEQLFLYWYRAGLRGARPATPAPGFSWSWEDLHALNTRLFEAHRDEPTSTILRAFYRSYEQIYRTVAGMSEEEIHAKDRYAWAAPWTLGDYIRENTCDHYRWAADLIYIWRQNTQ
ncbi:hypothetical protein EI42_04970 [Thermosporothrix hazakensis]|jgi:hypothetical protein|uniref:DinB family protein n=2 Tax=Thermosporothrix TaxID=768650 RepID=A0A326U0E5_THEHA|nr:ClbS/DfsB family four-helix bundle protein [Thermosporothrix hazakensis]PZW23587.1 hypothetical protein EI42_04970 [Thermosporothrix hazakensis]BBH86745.1 hypothetical protein KTC_14960 [Thermosporothrix sp. COM3]GCE51047.1 hypothetical protein KTH_59160 [Thermosporothrix hazakensis]